MYSKKRFIKTCLLVLPFLCSCFGNGNKSLEDSSFSSSSEVEIIPQEGLYFSYASRKITLGQNFIQGVSPTIYLNGEEIPLNSLAWTSLDKGNKNFSLYDLLLEEGNYIFKARKNGFSFEKSFEVVKGKPTTAKDKNGYYKVSDEERQKYALQNVPNAGALGRGKMPSTGEVHLLVIPLTFSDGPSFNEKELQAIQKGYFGEKSETGWESLSSYYETSSYGKLKISGEVTETYRSTYTEAGIQQAYNGNPTVSAKVMQEAVESVFSAHTDWDRTLYDSDKDGFLDGIEIIYKSSRNYYSGTGKGSTIWWNFTACNTSTKEDISKPQPRRYFWSNITQLMNGYYSPNIDTHTLVHETGHMLGLNDYYDYNQNSYPMGGADIMELNIGDHSAYSKYLLGWVNPLVIDGKLNDFEITLNSFPSSGDCILLRDTTFDPWNGTPYDEYLMLSYYTPTGLNEQDSEGYPEWKLAYGYGTGGMYSYRGLQITHIDERLFNNVGSTYDKLTGRLTKEKFSYTDDILNTLEVDENNQIVTDYAYQTSSNTNADSAEVKNHRLVKNSSFKETTLIPASGDGTLFQTTTRSKTCKNLGSSDVLMGLTEYGCQNNGFSMSKMETCFPKKSLFNDGSELEYNFFVSYQSEDKITVRFVRNLYF